MKKEILIALSALTLFTTVGTVTPAHAEKLTEANYNIEHPIYHPSEGFEIQHPIYRPSEGIEIQHPVYRYKNKTEHQESVEMKHIHVTGKISKDSKSGFYKLNAPLMTYELKGTLSTEMKGLVGSVIEVHGEVPDYRYIMAPAQETMYLTSYQIIDEQKTIFLEGRIVKNKDKNPEYTYEFQTKKNTYPLLGQLNYKAFENKMVIAYGRVVKSADENEISLKPESIQLTNKKKLSAVGTLAVKDNNYILKAESGKEYTLNYEKKNNSIENHVGEELTVEGVFSNLIKGVLKVYTYSILGTYSFPKFKGGHLI